MCFRYGSKDHFIANCPKPETSDKKFNWKTENPKNCAYRQKKIYKTPENSTDKSDSQKIYRHMSRISSNVESPRISYGENSQPNNWILDSADPFHRKPYI